MLIKVSIIMDDAESLINFDPSCKFSILKNIISMSLKIDLNDYQIIHNNKKIQDEDNLLLKDVVGNNKLPIFVIKKKGIII